MKLKSDVLECITCWILYCIGWLIEKMFAKLCPPYCSLLLYHVILMVMFKSMFYLMMCFVVMSKGKFLLYIQIIKLIVLYCIVLYCIVLYCIETVIVCLLVREDLHIFSIKKFIKFPFDYLKWWMLKQILKWCTLHLCCIFILLICCWLL